MILSSYFSGCGDDAASTGPEDDAIEEADSGATRGSPRDASSPRDARADARSTTPADAAGEAEEDAAIEDASGPIDEGKDASLRDAGQASDAGRGSDAGQTTADAGASACDSLTYVSFGQQFMSSYCVSCHGPLLAQKNVHLDTLAGIVAAKNKVKAETSSSAMPPRGSKAPTSAERKQLAQWIDCGPK